MKTLKLLNIAVGLFLIIIGFLVEKYPNMIAGYNMMPKEKKKHVDIKGLSTFIRNVFIIMGLLLIGGIYLFNWLGISEKLYILNLSVIIVGTIIILILAQKYDHNKKQKPH